MHARARLRVLALAIARALARGLLRAPLLQLVLFELSLLRRRAVPFAAFAESFVGSMEFAKRAHDALLDEAGLSIEAAAALRRPGAQGWLLNALLATAAEGAPELFAPSLYRDLIFRSLLGQADVYFGLVLTGNATIMPRGV